MVAVFFEYVSFFFHVCVTLNWLHKDAETMTQLPNINYNDDDDDDEKKK